MSPINAHPTLASNEQEFTVFVMYVIVVGTSINISLQAMEKDEEMSFLARFQVYGLFKTTARNETGPEENTARKT